jgi:hypothetical protein
MAIARSASGFDVERSLPYVAQPAPKSQIWDMLRVFAAFATMFLARGQTDRARFWGIFGVGALIALIALYRPAFAALQRIWRRLHDNRVVRKRQQEFRRITREAGSFMDSNISSSDTLAALLNQVNQRLSGQSQNALVIAIGRIPQTQIFMDRWYCFNTRIQNDKLSAVQFHTAVDELVAILRCHTNYCAMPIFHTFASEYRELLTDSEKSQFNAFQQSYRAYLERLAEFVNRLNDDFRKLPELSATIALPKPL